MLNLDTTPTVPDALTIRGKVELFPDWSQRCIKVAGTDKKSVYRVLGKLQSVLNIFRNVYTPRILQTPILNCHQRFQLIFVPMSKQEDMMRTTLWRKCKAEIYDQTKFYTVRVQELDRKTKKWNNKRIESRNVIVDPTWKRRINWEYTYKGKEPIGKLHQLTMDELMGQEDVWIDAADHVFTYWPDQETQYGEQDNLPAYASKAVRTIRARAASGRSDNSVKDSQIDEVVDEDGGMSFGARPGAAAEEAPVTRTTRKVRERPGAPESKTATVQRYVESLPTPQVEPSDENDPNAEFGFGSRPGAPKTTTDGTRTPRNAKSTTSKSRSVSQATTFRGGNLLDLDSDGELDSRQLRNTMGQKAPRGKNDRARSQSAMSRTEAKVYSASDRLWRDNIDLMKDSFLGAFDFARTFQGLIEVEAQFGRVLYHGMSRQLFRNPILPAEWHEHIRSEPGDIVKFTEVLTTETRDAEFIANMRHQDSDLFEARPYKRSVTYEIKCFDPITQKSILIAIDAGSHKITVKGAPVHLTAINMTLPQLSWDVRVGMTVYKLIDPAQNLGVKAIVDTLCIKGKTTKPALTFTTINADYIVKEVLVKRQMCYRMMPNDLYKNNPFELRINEVHDLDLKRKTDGSNNYRAAGREVESMREKGRLFYTASVLPVIVNEKLKENSTLEVGSAASWDAEGMMGSTKAGPNQAWARSEIDMIDALVRTTWMMAGKMDNVGHNNVSSSQFL